jgi:hypothetical protein
MKWGKGQSGMINNKHAKMMLHKLNAAGIRCSYVTYTKYNDKIKGVVTWHRFTRWKPHPVKPDKYIALNEDFQRIEFMVKYMKELSEGEIQEKEQKQ